MSCPRSDRITWTCDAAGTLIRVGGATDGIVAALRSRAWTHFPDGDAILAAIRAGHSFRMLPIRLYPSGCAQAVRLLVSGSPAGPRLAAKHWLGYATVAPSFGPPNIPVKHESCERTDPEELGSGMMPNETQPPTLPAVPKPIDKFCLAEARPVHNDIRQEDHDRRLSGLERDAFEEIGRALGGALSPATSQAAGALPNVVLMPAPALQTVAGVLESLPAGVVVARARQVLFATRRTVEILGGEVVGADDPTGDRVRALVERAGEDRIVVLHHGGTTFRLLVERSTIEWGDGSADLLLVRPAPTVMLWTDVDMGEPERARRTTLDPLGRLIAVDIHRARDPDVPAVSTPAVLLPLPVPAMPIVPTATVSATESRSWNARCSDAASSRGTVVPLRQRVEHLLAVERPSELPHQAMPADRPPKPATSPGRDAAHERDVAFLSEVSLALRAALQGITDGLDALVARDPDLARRPDARLILDAIRNGRHEAESGVHALGVWTQAIDDPGGGSATEAIDVMLSGCITELQPRAGRARVLLRHSLDCAGAVPGIAVSLLRRAAFDVIAYSLARSASGGQVIVTSTPDSMGRAIVRVRTSALRLDGGAARPCLMLARRLVESGGGQFRVEDGAGAGMLVEITAAAGEP